MTTTWPVYFLKRAPLHPGRRTAGLAAGDPFPWQDKIVIKRMGSAFGVLNAMDQRFADLDYVVCVNVGSEVVRQQILKDNTNLQAVQTLLRSDGSDDVVPVAPKADRAARRRSEGVNAHG